MKKLFTQFVSFLMVIVMIFGLFSRFPNTVLAEDGINELAEEIETTESLEGKTLSILGDSISTYRGVSNNSSCNSTIGSNAVYYCDGTLGVYRTDTWWQQTIDALGMELLVNNSWSGSTVFQPRKGKDSVGYGDRSVNLHNDATGEEPDVIVVFLGTNDFSYYQSTLGTADIDYDALIEGDSGTYTYATPATTCEAYAIMLHKIMNHYPNAEIYCMTMTARRDPDKVDNYEDVGQPTEFNAELTKVIEHFGCTVVDLENCGICKDAETFDQYMGDGRVHPNAAGMNMITEALISEMLGRQVEIYDVSGTYTGISTDNDTKLVIGGESYTAKMTLADAYTDMDVTVTMGGKDITASVYSGGVINIDCITGDVVISATAQKAPSEYRWEFNGSNLVSVGNIQNTLTMQAGSVSDGLLQNVYYSLENQVLLRHDLPWKVEFKVAGSWSGMILSAQENSSTTGNTFLFKTTSTTGFVAFGERKDGQYQNYGVALEAQGVDTTAEHTYHLENRIDSDGSNMVYLLVDDVDYGPMNNYFIGGTNDQGTTVDWINGRDLTFSYIGANGHAMKNCSIEYIQIWENYHVHSYEAEVIAPTCTQAGYTTHACACGDSYVDTYVAPLVHSYKNAVCVACGAKHPNMTNYEGKVISILGDSISTFAGYIPTADGFNLEHYARYPQDNLLTDVNETWWMQVLTSLDAKLGINESWRSTEVYNYIDAEVNSTYDGTKACMASLTRIQNLGSNGTPDVILFYGGTNDITQRRTVGTFDPETAPTEVDLTSVKWDTVADAYVAAIMRMQYYYPDTQIIAMLPTFTSKNTDTVIEEYNSLFAKICEHYGVTYIDLRDCGISTSNLPDGTHPDAEGMDYITAAVLDELLTNCNVEKGENVVCSVTHELTAAESSLSYYKGVSYGNSFTTIISGEDVSVKVTLDGVDITESCYDEGVIHIENTTGDIVISAVGKEQPVYAENLQQLPDNICCGINLWKALKPENQYYTASGWGNLSSGLAWSITIPINPNDQIFATSFKKYGENGNTSSTSNGIRVTFFDSEGVLKAMSPAETYAEFSVNGFLTAPEGAVAINIPVWTNSDENEIYIETLPHSYSEWTITKNESCTEDGEKQRDCANCDAYETEAVSKTGHSYKSVVTDPTCTEVGYTTYTCVNCNDSYVDNKVNASGHNFGEWTITRLAICTEKGEERRECSVCKHYETREVEELGHIYEKEVTTPICTKQGYTTNTCKGCGDMYVDAYVEATGHNYKPEVTAPTCTEQGYTTYSCIQCGKFYDDHFVAASGHVYGDWTEIKAPTETELGEERLDCEHCDYYRIREITATGHSYEAVVTQPTCTEQGYTTHICECGDSYIDNYTKALDHDYVATTTESTCTEEGYTTHTCERCKQSYVDTYVEATGHNYGQWTETKAPSETEVGEERRDCENCDVYEVREVDKLEVITYFYGDVNLDNSVQAEDALAVLKHVVKLQLLTDETALELADVNHDNKVDASDALEILRMVVKIRDMEICRQSHNNKESSNAYIK